MTTDVSGSDWKTEFPPARHLGPKTNQSNKRSNLNALIDQYNTEYDLLKEVITKSLAVKIDEVREDERKKAEEALKRQDLEY